MNIDIKLDITEDALKELKRSLIESELNDSLVRIFAQPGGCSGFSYKLAFVKKDEINSDDLVEKIGEVEVVVDRKSLLFLDGVKIDWVDDSSQKGFKFVNLNSKKSCACSKK